MEKLAGSGMTMLVITHEMMFAKDASDRIVFMDDGLIVEEGVPSQLLFNPRQARTRQFLQRLSGGKPGSGLSGVNTDGA